MTQERARFGPAQSFAALGLLLGQEPIERGGADLLEKLLLPGPQPTVMALIMG
jgi:hypothetical protein